jgi:hypothetical protein
MSIPGQEHNGVNHVNRIKIRGKGRLGLGHAQNITRTPGVVTGPATA